MSSPKRGTATASLRGRDGEELTVIVPAVLQGEQLLISADNLSTLRATMHAAGVEDAELEFSELEV
ncbi:hypothetical protein XI06_22865 [Bradyrhizobium sp. CCBAU 11434]|uniref:hypothetical protein n=1 Tax=Bradyrhizobium sp. CCBAU 11434 TaxID=1630885 RepID=UPI00230675E1|nr:hypothetical protein [Bradyrhizobium sp. CCBAU 11434]MDA9523041.1 hypothetical protein [Bradyrhizobium sp. CCBAU 11434]